MIRQQKGFTIVELLIVIVVIAILAAITIVAYNGIQRNARDSIRKSDISNLVKALSRYNIDKGDYANAGCGNGSGSGFVGLVYTTNKTINECLIEGGYAQKPFVDPTGSLSCSSGTVCYAYVKANCGSEQFLFARLETLPAATTEADGTCYPTWDTSYGLNYVVKI